MRKKLETVGLSARRKMLEFRQVLVPEAMDSLSAIELAGRVRQQLASLPVGQRRLLRVKIALAVKDLEELNAALSHQFGEVRKELQRIQRYRAAAIAYGRQGEKKSRRGRQRRPARPH
jgi:ABC-type branched-subunit amino acid transport system ATPase component